MSGHAVRPEAPWVHVPIPPNPYAPWTRLEDEEFNRAQGRPLAERATYCGPVRTNSPHHDRKAA